jgi:hypothetical protein
MCPSQNMRIEATKEEHQGKYNCLSDTTNI